MTVSEDCTVLDDGNLKVIYPDANSNEWIREETEYLVNRKSRKGILPYIEVGEISSSEFSDKKLIGIDGYWYDISKFIPYHPGGDVIEKFVGKDATAVFKSMHYNDVLGKRKPVAYYERDLTDPASVKFSQLRDYFQREGYFQTDLHWYFRKVSVTFLLGIVSIYILVTARDFLTRLIGGVLLAAFWQQCGFHLHDLMHNQVFHNRIWDQRLGTFFGTALLGLSASWWRDEHFIHHALTNTIDYDTQFVDPQMHEPSWAQNPKLFPLHKTKMEKFMISIQHITFLPICICLGRPYIIIDALLKERRVHEWLASIAHFSWTCFVFSYFPSWGQIFAVYFLASSLQGILHVQLLLNHYAKAFFQLDEICNEKDWYRMQIEGNLNIKNPVWLDWFHGGLNLHIEHHLYPNMPRHNFRKASVHIKRVCSELGIKYDEMCLSSAAVYTLKHLKTCGELFSLDPR